MNHDPFKIIAVFLCLSSSAYTQSSDSYTYYWGGGRIAGTVVVCCIAASRRRRSHAQSGVPYSPPIWQGAQTYSASTWSPCPPNTANMNPYELNEYPGSQPPPPPYVKGGEGVSMPQETSYSSPPGLPPAARTVRQ
ncbi:hypothetical protein BD769DRAFT_1391890 [Suillus cothurnatus]|nr:hypothetical protein BD769DRAFT_1391890 [Suillus cothurnatus]